MVDAIADNLGPIILGIACLATALILFVRWQKYDSVEAVCLSVTKEVRYSLLVGMGYKGTYQYFYQGKKYISRDRSSLNPFTLTVGQTYRLYVNPEKPDFFITDFSLICMKIFFVVGVLLVFLPILL